MATTNITTTCLFELYNPFNHFTTHEFPIRKRQSLSSINMWVVARVVALGHTVIIHIQNSNLVL